MKTKKLVKIWARTLTALSEEKTEKEFEKNIERLRVLLKAKKKEYILPKILEKVLKALEKKNKIELVLAREFDSGGQKKIKEKLEELFGEGKEIETKINEAIIGGFLAKTENHLIDGSIKNYLDELKQAVLAK